MKPTIDVHAHIFNARDIPLEGYLRSREPVTGIEKVLSSVGLKSVLIPAIAKYIREKNRRWREQDLDTDRTIGEIALEVGCAILGKEYKQWADTLSKEVTQIAEEMANAYKDQIDLYVPLMIDYVKMSVKE